MQFCFFEEADGALLSSPRMVCSEVSNWYFCLSLSYLLQSINMLSAVILVPQEGHVAGSSFFFAKWTCVSLVCPILSLVMTRFICLSLFRDEGLWKGVFLIRLNFGELLCHVLNQVDVISAFASCLKSSNGVFIMMGFCCCAPSLASLSAFSLPLMFTWAGTQHSVVLPLHSWRVFLILVIQGC